MSCVSHVFCLLIEHPTNVAVQITIHDMYSISEANMVRTLTMVFLFLFHRLLTYPSQGIFFVSRFLFHRLLKYPSQGMSVLRFKVVYQYR